MDRWAPVLFDVLNDEFRSSEVVDEWTHTVIVHSVGHVTYKENVFAKLHDLADAEWSAEHAHGSGGG